MTSASGSTASLGMTPDGAVIRRLTLDDDLEPDLRLARQVFGSLPGSADRRLAGARLCVADGRYLGAYSGGTLLGSARYLDTRQWWQGRSLPMAAVAGVKAAPHAQGRGLGTALMSALLAEMAGRGYPLSVLYPMTAPVYRALGWEIAGGLTEATVPARSLRTLIPPDPAVTGVPDRLPADGRPGGSQPGGGSGFRPAGAADAAEMVSVLGRLHAAGRDCGPITFDVPHLTWMLGQDISYLYLAPDGALGYQLDLGKDEVLVHCAAAGSAATARSLWSIVASHATAVSGVRALVSPADPLPLLTREADVTMTTAGQWMLRLLDAPAAIAGRGYPASAAVTAVTAISDPQLPANSGDWRLEISGGDGVLTRLAPGATPQPGAQPGALPGVLRLGSRGLAALYAGTSLAALRRSGLAAGGSPDTDAALDEAFAGTAWMTDSF
jgi:GNAT superfamily N-acetyltransferase